MEILNHVQKFLSACGADVILNNEALAEENTNFHFKLALFEIPTIKEPVMELTHNLKSTNQKWLSLFQHECKISGTKFKTNELVNNENSHFIKVHVMYPEIEDRSFWNQFGENCAITITLGILSRILESSSSSVFSIVPLDILMTNFSKTNKKNAIPKKQDEIRLLDDQKLDSGKLMIDKRLEAEVFFDYHFLIDENEGLKLKVLGNLHIKNIGTEILRNPAICLRSTPSESIKISGQILPPNVAETLGMMNNEGTKGWKYMNNDWFEEAEKKGETWISPIHPLIINPGKTESLSNFQISLHNLEKYDHFRVEAFVFFKEQELEIASNNKILLSFTVKKE
ncbi:hypothetical protein [Bacillus methanolicus]|uniref:hypothetical protein n=1 Tax=Bacillus methanolicus TaxID=1471 RepID=UPI0023805468|nr:hypothetical protein [Bacillus methanolicus]